MRPAILLIAAAVAAVVFSGDILGARAGAPATEVGVTLKSPPLSAFGRSLQSASHAGYLRRIDAAQNELASRIVDAVPGADIRWRYRLVANGLAVTVPRGATSVLA